MKLITAFILFSLTIFNVHASPVEVKVVWPYSIVSEQGLMYKELVESANQIQDRYKFIFVNKPGAGGSLAVLSVENDTDLSLLAHSSSFYIRPNLYSNAHNVNNFRILNQICVDQPLAMLSKKYSSIKDAIDKEVKIGIIPGSITSLISKNIVKNNSGIKFIEIPYKNTPDATNDMLGEHIDGSIEFLGKTTMARLPKSVNVVGITGTKNIENIKTFSNQGIVGLENVTNTYYILARKNIEPTVGKELSSILQKAINKKVREYCESAYGNILEIDYQSLESVHNEQISIWKKVSSDLTSK